VSALLEKIGEREKYKEALFTYPSLEGINAEKIWEIYQNVIPFIRK
jgi:hypothetical protein